MREKKRLKGRGAYKKDFPGDQENMPLLNFIPGDAAQNLNLEDSDLRRRIGMTEKRKLVGAKKGKKEGRKRGRKAPGR